MRQGRAARLGATGRAVRALLGATALAAALLAAGCGKKGAPVPPGPQEEIMYPRAYPSK